MRWASLGQKIPSFRGVLPMADFYSAVDNSLPPRPRAPRAHRTVISEIGLRFPLPRGADLEAHRVRLELLAWDCRHVPADLLREACDRAALKAKGLPYASEILAYVEDLREERHRSQLGSADRQQTSGSVASQAYAARNREAAEQNAPGRLTSDREFFLMNDCNETRGCRADGTVIEPRFDAQLHARSADERDLPLLAEQYAQFRRKYRVSGRRIVRLE
jgi:hypothetical protein